LGNKSDLRGKNSISVKDIEKYVNSLDEKAKEYNFSVKFLETSAKTGLNVDEAFETLGRQIMKRSFNVEI
ncbi:MAG: hypothetical protein OEY49_10885, partial [Candidatus Heimdallarchaeota archaeon]|nr:hypothetical protein [Candidatus Heimdallarchaeota archaeon]